jgi:hypothetical protein
MSRTKRLAGGLDRVCSTLFSRTHQISCAEAVALQPVLYLTFVVSKNSVYLTASGCRPDLRDHKALNNLPDTAHLCGSKRAIQRVWGWSGNFAGDPGIAIIRSSSRATRTPEIEVSATSAGASRVKSSTTARMRKLRPSLIRSLKTSSGQRRVWGRSRNFMEHPRQYRWSSYRAHAEGKDDALAQSPRCLPPPGPHSGGARVSLARS